MRWNKYSIGLPQLLLTRPTESPTNKPPRRFAPYRLDFDTPLTSIATLPQYRFHPVPIRGYHLQTLRTIGFLTLPFSRFFSSSPFPYFPAPSSFPLSHSFYICA